MTGRTAVVMTMGALHEGHRALMRLARAAADDVIVTIFVNPLQFGPSEDLDRYPRPFDADVAACEAEGVDLVFAPTPDVVYPDGDALVRVTAGVLGERLCGASRPGHFDGVLTVVSKLLHLTRPDVAFFGEKDAQQLALIRRMVRDLDFDVEVVGVPTVREPDGLALSSRNAYLDASQRAAALAISRSLAAGRSAAAQGPQAVLVAARAVLDAEPGLRLDYLELVDPDTLEPLDRSHEAALLAVAAWSGSTRLIDNVTIHVGPPGPAGMYSKET
jgi:pantoate--beta-alanine ligase